MERPIPHPLETTLPIPGLAHPVTILQITDLHACAWNPDEEATMPAGRLDYIRARRGAFSEGRPYPPEEVLPVLVDYAAEIEADVVLLTGDILDFPSDGNLALLGRELTRSAVPVLYITGNHDWSFADDYHTPHAAEAHLTRVEELSHATDGVVTLETPDIFLCALDNGRDRIRPSQVSAYRAACDHARVVGKPLILAMHVPMTTETLVPETVRVWRRDINLGVGALGAGDETTVAFWSTVTHGPLGSDYVPAAVITGHLHFNHEDVYPNGVTQIVTAIASGGLCRVVHLVPMNKEG